MLNLQRARGSGLAGVLLFIFLWAVFASCSSAPNFFNKKYLHESAKSEILSWRILSSPNLLCVKNEGAGIQDSHPCQESPVPQWHLDVHDYNFVDALPKQNLLN